MVELHTRHTATLATELSNLMWGADAKGRTTFVSDALLKAAGYEQDTLTGGPLSDLLMSDDGAELSAELAGQLLGSELRLPLRLRTRNGATYRIAWDRLPKRDRDGHVVEVMGVARELLPALEPDPLRDAQLDLFDAARTCIVGMRPDGAIVYANREAERLLGSASRGLDEASLVGRNYFELLAPPDDGTAWRNTKEHIEACLGAHDYETAMLARNGRRVVMRWSSAPMRAGGTPAAPGLIFLFGFDVTEQRRRESEERVRNVIAALAGVSLSFDAYFDAVQLHLAQLMSFDAAAVVTLRRDSRDEASGFVHAARSAAVEPLLVSGTAIGLPIDEEVVHAAIRDLRPYACFGGEVDANEPAAAQMGGAAGSYIVLPLVAGGAALGAFVLAASAGDGLRERHVGFLESIGPDLARALQVHVLRGDLDAARAAHRVLFDQAQEGVLLLDGELRCVEVNGAARRILGMPGLKADGRSIDVLLDAEEPRALRRKLRELGRTSGCALGTFVLRREGAGGRVEVEAFAARRNGGLLVLLGDVTNHNQARRELVERERALGWVARSVSDGAALIRRGRLEEINEALLALFGYDVANELSGRPVDVLCADRSEGNGLGELEHTIREDGKLLARHTFMGRRRDGSTVRVEARATTFGDDDPATLLVLRNVSTDERLEEFMRRSAQTAGVAELAGNTAREFNDLLVTVLGATTMARSLQPGDPRHTAMLGSIRDAASRAAELTSELLAASRGGQYVVEPVSLNQSVCDVLAMVKACIPRDVRVTTDLTADLPPVEGDPYQFAHVVLQAVLNAIEAMPPPWRGELAISTGLHEAGKEPDPDRPDVRPGRYVRVAIADSGPGMDADTLRRVCEPFFTTKGAGRGLGMAAARSIVTHHNGFLSLTSSPGDGTEIEVLLPVQGIRPRASEAT